MAIRIALGPYTTRLADPLGRDHVGYFPRMTAQEAWSSGRGPWMAERDRLAGQRFALITGEGIVRAVVEITGTTSVKGGTALEGRVLEPGHEVHDAYWGKPDPVETTSFNPIGYVTLPEERPLLHQGCGCNCGELTTRDFVQGHDVHAIRTRISTYFESSLEFLHWLDARLATDPPPRVARAGERTDTASHQEAELDVPSPAAAVPASIATSPKGASPTLPEPIAPEPVPALVRTLQDTVVRVWRMGTVRWAMLAEIARDHDLTLSNRAAVDKALTQTFGDAAPTADRDRHGAWSYSVTDLWAAANTWRATHLPDTSSTLDYCRGRADLESFIELLQRVTTAREGLDLTNKTRFLKSLGANNIAVPVADRARLAEILLHPHHNAASWFQTAV